MQLCEADILHRPRAATLEVVITRTCCTRAIHLPALPGRQSCTINVYQVAELSRADYAFHKRYLPRQDCATMNDA